MIYNETYTLSNGVRIPKLGLGTWLMNDEQTAQAVRDGVRLGYRHIDTAQAYENESGVGEGIRTCGVAREELFITTKVAAECKSYDSAAASIDQSLKEAGLSYYDMIIIHHPQPWMEVNQSDNRYYEENRQVWKALEDAYKAGKVKAIGLSNFQKEDVENILTSCEIRPMVNQVLNEHVDEILKLRSLNLLEQVCKTHPVPKLIKFCQANAILVEAYSPVAHGAVLGNKQIKTMADQYGVSIPQLCLKYDIQLGLVVLPKTANPAHMENNADLDFMITDEDMETLKNMEQIKDYGAHSFFPVFGGKL